jgi:ABC-type sugar transport system substrate-binding protein
MIVGVLVFFTGCAKSSGPTAADPGKIKLGFLVKQPEEPWFQFEWKGAENAAAHHGFEIIKLGVPDGEKVIAAIDNLAALGAKGFVICTPDVRLGPAIVRKSKPTGFFGSMLVSAPGEGFRTAEMHHRRVKEGTPPPPDTRTTGIFITRENFEQVLKREGIVE